MLALPAGSAETPGAEVRFNRDVFPILSENCLECHGPDKAGRKAGLRLDQREIAVAELESGARAIVPGDTKLSELMARITADDPEDVMPPQKTGKRLTPREVDVLQRWIESGAAYEKHWALIPPVRVEPPAIEAASHPVDHFVRARLRNEAISPAPGADRPTLIRRVTLDLTGLPPSPLEVDAFVNDARTDAYERVVDRLLASEQFGEKWARWWLDLAHYADSDGYLSDFERPNAWRYRQWVVDALNRDMPFDRFTIEQLAGDLLPGATVSQRTATGFLRNTLSNREGGADLEEFRIRQVIDRTGTVGTVWMGLSLACAECHDHKFDPISQRDFYQFFAFFNDADELNIDAPQPGELAEYQDAKRKYDLKRAELLEPVAAPLAEMQAAWEEKVRWAEANPDADPTWSRAYEVLGLTWGQGRGEGQLEGVRILMTPHVERTQEQKDRLLDHFLVGGNVIDSARFKELNLPELHRKLDDLGKGLPAVTRAPTMVRSLAPRPTHIFARGDFRRPEEEVLPGTPTVLPPLAVKGRADRLALADWLISAENPLTARVTVNRLWQELFGRGLVAPSDNFGVRGGRPTHPELLNWMASEFSGAGWSLKHMLRLMVTAQTYRQSSQARPEIAARDPGNALLARQSRLRLSAEIVRDVTLAASGLLNRTIGGPSVRPPQPESVSKEAFSNTWVAEKGAGRYRRGLYTFIQRLSPFGQFANFDLPNTSKSCTQRDRSNTPLQALNLLNDPAYVEAAQALASRVWRERPGGTTARLEHAFLVTLARPPSAAELARLTDYLAQQQTVFEQDPGAARELAPELLPGSASPAESAAWVAVASVMLNLDEFINRE